MHTAGCGFSSPGQLCPSVQTLDGCGFSSPGQLCPSVQTAGCGVSSPGQLCPSVQGWDTAGAAAAVVACAAAGVMVICTGLPLAVAWMGVADTDCVVRVTGF